MSDTVSLTVYPGQLTIVTSADGVLALKRWMRLRDQALHVRASYDNAQR